ncbi:MAG TPA: MFS transporter, partial [Chloroflexota bacterium]|nr:MFS transporter [Chloroflexota bacterium]
MFSQIGTRGTVAANLWQVLQLTDSTLQVGLVGLAEAAALLVLAPLGGAVADRMDRRTLLQLTQSTSLVASSALAVLTFSGLAQAWHIYVAVVAISAAQSFEGPARQALIPALVSKDRVVDAFALTNPTRELAILLG